MDTDVAFIACPPLFSFSDLLREARDRFCRMARKMAAPIGIADLASQWDACSRSVLADAVACRGGGCLSTLVGTWESCT